MGIPTRYSQGGMPSISYDFTDLEEGTGYTIFNGCSAESGSGEQFILTTTEPYSHLISNSGALAGVGSQWSMAFYTPVLNLPRILQGTALVNFTWKVTNSSSSNNNFPYLIISKWDGTTDTQIATASGAIVNSANGTAKTTIIKTSAITPTLINIGEQIKLTMGIEVSTSGAGTIGFFAHDPQNEADDWFTTNNYRTTKLKFNAPFKIDV